MQSAKQTAANVAASAKAGMEKTKATMQEKAEKMTTRDPVQKEMATEKKQERFHEAEREKHEARGTHAPTGGAFGHTTGGDYPVGGGQHAVGSGGGYGGDVPQDYPQGMGGQMDYPEGGMGLGSGGVGLTDPNVGGGARTGHGSGGTI